MPQPQLVHRPAGDGHPYAASPDQRVPYRPAVGDEIVLGVRAPGADVVTGALVSPSGRETPLALTRGPADATDAAALAGGDGHLAAAQAATASTGDVWHVRLAALGEPGTWRYRFEAASGGEGHAGADVAGEVGAVAGAAGDAAAEASAVGTPWFDLPVGAWGDAAGGTLRVNGSAMHPRLVPDSVAWFTDDEGTWRVRLALRLEPEEHVVGFGERFEAVDLRGRELDAVVFEQYKSQGVHARTYLPMPFAHVIGGDGWGFHVRTSRRTWFDVGASDPGLLWIEAALGGAPELDLDVWDGSVGDVLRGFLDVAGHPEELPDWVLGLWASGNEWNTAALVTEQMDRHRDLDVPVDVVVVEAWSDELGITELRDSRHELHADGSPRSLADVTFDADGAWPDPRAWIDDLHARGIRVLLWQIPLLKTDGTIALDETPWTDEQTRQVLADGAALERSGHVVREADGSAYRNRGWWFPRALLPDLSTPEGRAHWTEYRRYLVEELDIDGFKTDGGEHAWGDELVYGDGRRGDEGNNLVPVNYARAFGDLLRSAGKAPVTFSRSGFTGSQAHGVFWAGDENSTWEAMRHSLNAGLTASVCGIVYWGWDLAGFSGPVPDAELYLRAVAMSAFLPVMQYHSEFNHHELPLRDRTPWNVAELSGVPEVVDVFRDYAHLRRRLRPYLARSAREAIETSVPFLRGLWVDFGGEAEVWRRPAQFLIGPDVLVSPVTEPGATRWETYLPGGAGVRWRDAWTGESYAGGSVVEREVPLAVVPVYVREESWAELAAVFHP
ncbi:MAG: glycoside hydrolase family 31 [Micrococcales bacterium 73-15]|uniref:glycoside hydrolase family 31 protein n=1 Tax=Salana multivorans TaxID=120377 RepID=UPI000966FC43|nr:TIM-barrel domain-containing protein [Salana multivorans]OJX97049.1 MAG: glycoside hydrolase family 31 [Micrococcales bacterium 73-15]